MNWEAIGAIGELAGAVVVVATLFYLSFQLRQNTLELKSNRLENWLSNANSINEFRAQHAEVLAKALSGSDTTAAEEMVVDALAQKLFLIMETNYLHYKDGIVPEAIYESRMASLLHGLENPAVRRCWDNSQGYSLSREFVDVVNEELRRDE